jgi:ATP-binding cassette subfamily B protein
VTPPDPEVGQDDARGAGGRALRRWPELVRGQGVLYFAGGVGLVLSMAATLVYPQLVRLVIDRVAGQRDAAALRPVAAAMLAVVTVDALAVLLRDYSLALAGERVLARLRTRLFEALVGHEIGFFDAARSGALSSRLLLDTETLRDALGREMLQLLYDGGYVLGGVGLMLSISTRLTVSLLPLVPPILLVVWFGGRVVRPRAAARQAAAAELNALSSEMLSGIRTLRSLGREDTAASRFAAAASEVVRRARGLLLAQLTATASGQWLAEIAGVVVIFVGANLTVRGELTTGLLIAYVLYTMRVVQSASGLVSYATLVHRALGATARVFTLLDRVPRLPVSGSGRLSEVQGAIAFEAVHFAYPGREEPPALDGVELQIAPGERVALVGSSGAGKSTLVAQLVRFYEPTTGVVRLDGHDLATLDAGWLRSQIGFVEQTGAMFAGSLADNLRLGKPDASDEDLWRALRVASLEALVRSLPEGLATSIGERGLRLSGGERQRLAVARAVLTDPRVLVLDEATSAMDAESEQLVSEALERLMRGRTTLLIAHRLSTMTRVDRVVVLDRGRVAQSGRHEELLLQGGIYARLVASQLLKSPGREELLS